MSRSAGKTARFDARPDPAPRRLATQAPRADYRPDRYRSMNASSDGNTLSI